MTSLGSTGRRLGALAGHGLSVAAAMLMLVACSKDVQGPKPAIEPPSKDASPPPVDPGIACREQLTTPITLNGKNFSPIAIDVPGDPKTALPSITITRSAELDGAGVSEPESVLFSGDPDADPTNAFSPDGELPLVTWVSRQEMTFTVIPELTLADGEPGTLAEGVWDVTVLNPNGDEVQSPGSLALVSKPLFNEVTPGITCLEEGARDVRLIGRTILRNGDKQAVLQIEGVDKDQTLELDADTCTDIAHAGIDAQMCNEAVANLAQDLIEKGFHPLTILSPETAACSSVDDVRLRVVPSPVIDRVVPVPGDGTERRGGLGCVTEGPRSFIVEGEDFLRIDDVMPVVTVLLPDGDTSVAYPADSMAGCEDVETQGHTVERCTSVTFTVPVAGDDDSLQPALYDVMVENPAPAGCGALAEEALRIVPPPDIQDVVPPLVCLEDSRELIQLEGQDFLVIEGEVPAVAVDGKPVDPDDVVAAECEPLQTPNLDVRICDRLDVTLAKDWVKLGDKDNVEPVIEVLNPDPAGCMDVHDDLLTAIARPAVEEVVPGIVCLDQGDRGIRLNGATFLHHDGREPGLFVEDVDDPFEAALSECEDLPQAKREKGLEAKLCQVADVVLPEGSIDVGFPALELLNPETAACVSKDDIKLRVVPPPVIDRVVPPMGCLAEGPRVFVIEGQDFLRVDTVPPIITIAGTTYSVDDMNCTDTLETQGHEVELCSSITFTVPSDGQPGNLAPALYDVMVTNPDPAGCGMTAVGALRIVPRPDILDMQGIQPPLICVDDSAVGVTLTGTDFLVVDGVVPSVQVDGNLIDPGSVLAETGDVGKCLPLVVDGLTVFTCTELTVTIPMDGSTPGTPEVVVTNPLPAGCSDTHSDLLTVVVGPEITDASPALLCTVDGSRVVSITGTDILRVNSMDPVVNIGGSAASINSMTCGAPTMANGVTVEVCTGIEVTVAMGALSAGRPAVEVINPAPADCSASRSDLLTVPPTLAINSLTPPNVCQGVVNNAFPLTLTGEGFLRVDGSDFTLTFDGNPVVPTDIPAGDCTQIDVAGVNNVFSCDTIEATVDLTGLTATLGSIDVTVTNDQAADCALSETIAFNIVNPPTVSNIDIVGSPVDDQVCSEAGLTLVLTGDFFAPGATVTLVNDSGLIMADMVSVDSAMQITATFSAGLPFEISDPTWNLIVDNGAGCANVPIADAITVNPTPLVFFIDPPVTYNEVSIDVTIFSSGLGGSSTLDFVELVDSVGGSTVLCDTDGGNGIPDCGNPKPNRIVANVPGESGSPTFTAGDYEVHVTSTLGCQSALGGQLTVTDTLNGALLTAIDPSFVSPTVPTAVTVTGSGMLPLPRLYLTPSAGAGTATALRAVELDVSGTQATAIIPDGVTPGDYDLILVNPDGEVDVLPAAVTVTANEPPLIDSVVPASLAANTIDTITLQGANFDTVMAPMVELDCLSGMSVLGTAVATPDATTATASVNTASLAAGDVCLVRLTNPDGALFEFSALSITNSSLNLGDWTAGTAMTTARRAPSLEAGRPTNRSRFLYAMGGDSGTATATQIGTTVFDTIEAVPVDVFGTLGTWTEQRNKLPEPRTWAGSARIGRFLYMVGGHDDSAGADAATDTVYRAQILDPLATAQIAELDAQLGDPMAGTGLGGGLYYYRIAAVFPAGDPSNPGGESLAGESLPVQLPVLPEDVVLSLSWEEVPGASGYRIYRSPNADDPADLVQLLAEVTCGDPGCDCTPDGGGVLNLCPLQDDGTVATSASETPMPVGSLGMWHPVDGARCTDADCVMGTPREAHATVAVEDPGSPGTFYLYAFGGRDAGGTYLDSYEVATVTVAGDGSQTVADWVVASGALSEARAELGAFVMTADNSNAISDPADVWVYVGPGRTSTGFSTSLDVSLLGAAGTLGNPMGSVAANDEPGNLSGYAFGQANDQLFVFGGASGAPSSGGVSAKLCGPGSPGGCGALPDLEPGAWNALGSGAPLSSRVYSGSTQESAFFFICGGHDGATAIASTEQTVQ